MRIFVTGGAGYVGSAVVHELKREKHDLTVFDNLVYGHREAVPDGVKLVKGDLLDKELLVNAFKEKTPEAVMHFAAYTYVGESVKNPQKYFQNNIIGTLNLLSVMIEYNVKKIVFSSSAAVYGEPEKIPITEEAKLSPLSPYGETKVIIEKFLNWYDKAYGLKYISLRYFNAAGADLLNDIGEDHDPETHLIPLILKVALGQRKNIEIYGNDYPTRDGTCIRDYIHILDLASAHTLALKKLTQGGESSIYNLGAKVGSSVIEVIELSRLITKKEIPSKISPRRAGDPPILIASFDKIEKELGFSPKRDLKAIISDAWSWRSKHPNGYKS